MSDKEEPELPTFSKVKGRIDGNLFVESILVDGKPKFLVMDLNDRTIKVQSKIKTINQIWRPIKANECGYFPYSFSSKEIENLVAKPKSKQDILVEVKKQVDKFIVAPESVKILILGNILITYSQEWISTVHYPFFVGETESGKSSALYLGKYLNYRCLVSEDIPHADIYNFLGEDEEATGTICEDEAQEIYQDRKKIHTYKGSYAKGSSKPIVKMFANKKNQVYYKTFCCKWFAGESIPQDKGFSERLAIVNMVGGKPESNIKRPTDEEKEKLHQLRNKLLIWKLQNLGEYKRVDFGLTGRDQELWEDFLNVFTNTKFFDEAQKVADSYVNQRHDTIKNSLEAIVFKNLVNLMGLEQEVSALALWDALTRDNPDLPGVLDTKTRRTFYPDEHAAKLTMNTISKILTYKFQGKRISKVENHGNHSKKTTLYRFDADVIANLAEKYGLNPKNKTDG